MSDTTRWIKIPEPHLVPPQIWRGLDGEFVTSLAFWPFIAAEVLSRPFWRKGAMEVAAAQRIWRAFESAKAGELVELALQDWQWLSAEAQLPDARIPTVTLPAVWHHQAAIFGATDVKPAA